MYKKSLISIFILSVLLSCSSSPDLSPVIIEIPDKPNPSNELTKEENSIVNGTSTIEIPVVEYETNEKNTEDDAEIENPVDLVANNNIEYTVTPQKKDFNGGAIVYNYIPNNIYKIFLAPLKSTYVQLEPGESIVSDPQGGDQINFPISTSWSVIDGVRTNSIIIKTIYAGKNSNLTIATDRRVYHFNLISYNHTFMPIVSFNYPIDSFNKIKDSLKRQKDQLFLSGNLTDFFFGYDIVPMTAHKPQWMPSIVFNDGKKTYLHFASAKRASYAPVLFLVEDGQRILCNYRVVGSYYIVDQIIDRAELVLDVNKGNIIAIKKRN